MCKQNHTIDTIEPSPCVSRGFMQKVKATSYIGWDGGAQWSEEIGDHIRGGGEYGITWNHPSDPTYYVQNYQETWWKYVEKNNDGSPKRERQGKRCFLNKTW